MHTPGGPEPFNDAMRADLDHLLFQVTPDNILHIHHTLAAEATLIRVEVAKAHNGSVVGIAAKDPVSKPAADAFNAKIEHLLDQGAAYGDALDAMAEHLKRIAASYGHTEDEINASFHRFSVRYQSSAHVEAQRREPGWPDR